MARFRRRNFLYYSAVLSAALIASSLNQNVIAEEAVRQVGGMPAHERLQAPLVSRKTLDFKCINTSSRISVELNEERGTQFMEVILDGTRMSKLWMDGLNRETKRRNIGDMNGTCGSIDGASVFLRDRDYSVQDLSKPDLREGSLQIYRVGKEIVYRRFK